MTCRTVPAGHWTRPAIRSPGAQRATRRCASSSVCWQQTLDFVSQAGITQFPQLPLIKSQILCHHKELPGRLTVQCCCCKCQSKEEVARERAQGHLYLSLSSYHSPVFQPLPACFLLGCEKSYYILHNRRTEGATSSELQHRPYTRVSFSPYQPLQNTHIPRSFTAYPLSKLAPWLQPPPPFAFSVARPPCFRSTRRNHAGKLQVCFAETCRARC